MKIIVLFKSYILELFLSFTWYQRGNYLFNLSPYLNMDAMMLSEIFKKCDWHVPMLVPQTLCPRDHAIEIHGESLSRSS